MIDTKRILAALLLVTICSIQQLYSQALDNAPSHSTQYETPVDMRGFEKTNVSKATIQYQKLAYHKAITSYLKKEKKLTAGDKLRLAQALVKVGRVKEAAQWFSKSITKDSAPSLVLLYAQSLQASGDAVGAKLQYIDYEAKLRRSGSEESAYVFNSDVLDQSRFKNHDVQVYNETRINTKYLEFSPSFYKNGIVYVSTNPKADGKSNKDASIGESFMSIYQAELNSDGALMSAQAFSDVIYTKYHEGPLTFSTDGRELYFTRNSYQDGKKDLSKDEILKLKIFYTQLTDQKWSEPKTLNISTSNYQECHPTLSADGNTMIFASDRKGTNGKMDLFITIREGSSWSKPTNLGKTINTPGNEIFPFLHTDGQLYFASDLHDGLGGLDIFVSEPLGDGQWSAPTNLGTPFNSTSDDFGFIVDSDMHRGYFSSARQGGSGKDDIYSFLLPVNHEPAIEEVLAVVKPEVIRSPSPPVVTKTEAAKVVDQIRSEPVKTAVTKIAEAKPAEPAKAANCVTLLVGVIEQGTFASISDAEVVLTDKNTEATYVIKKDKNGVWTICLPCGIAYHLDATKDGYESGQVRISTAGIDCSKSHTIKSKIALKANSAQQPVLVETASPTIPQVSPPAIITSTKPVTTTAAPVKTKAPAYTASISPPSTERYNRGQVIVLNNIYYDFNKAYIKGEEQQDLDRLVKIMNDHPALIVELGAHTDTRGTTFYNQKLSEHRAKSAKEYLVQNGIAKNRIVAVGYGEGQPRVDCDNGIKCSEDQHLYNRRTEIKILDNLESDMAISYSDNLPSEYIGMNEQIWQTNVGISPNSMIKPSRPQSRSIIPSLNSNNQKLYVGTYSSMRNAEKKLKRLGDLDFNHAYIVTSPKSGNHSVILDHNMIGLEIKRLKSQLLDQGIKSIIINQ